MFSELKALLGLAGSAQKQLEFWRDFKGEEILIRTHTVQRGESDRLSESIHQHSFVIRGEIEDVMSFPPGFRLKNVSERIEVYDYSVILGQRDPYSSPAIQPGGGFTVRELDEKFVSFDAIDTLERAAAADDSTRPRHDSFEESRREEPRPGDVPDRRNNDEGSSDGEDQVSDNDSPT